MASSGFYTYDEVTGTITPDTTDILTDVETEYQTAFGASLVLQSNTPQKLLINAEALARAQVLQINSTVANSFNPNLAGGVALDAIGALTGLFRESASFTIVSCNLTGVIGTVISVGSFAQDTNGNVYQSQNTVTLVSNGSAGVATVNFVAVATGPITVAPNTLTKIVSNIIGWETVTNPTVQTSQGTTIQSDAAFRSLRQNTLALQGQGTAEAILSGVNALSGVTSTFFQENYTSAPLYLPANSSIGFTMVANSIYLCVAGGSNTDIANVLTQKKDAGCNYNNAIVDTQTGTAIGPPTLTPQNGTTVISTNAITALTDTSMLHAGMSVSGTGIPAGATVATITSGTAITISTNATASGTVSITFGGSTIITGLSSTTDFFVGQYISSVDFPANTTITLINNSTSITVSNTAIASGSSSYSLYGGIPQSVPVTNAFSGQTINVLFDNPRLIPIAVSVTASAKSTIQDPVTLIKNAIVAYATGQLSGNAGLTIGTAVSCFELAGAINTVSPSIYVSNVETSLASDIVYSNASIPIDVYQQATINPNNITVTLV
jgi:hypothetical protein